MAGTTRIIKRDWPILTAQTEGADYEMQGQVRFEEHNKVVADLETLRASVATGLAQLNLALSTIQNAKNGVVPGFPCGLDTDDASGTDVETNAITYVRYNGVNVTIPIDIAILTDAGTIGVTASSLVGQAKLGCLWIYAEALAAATCGCEAGHPGATSAENTTAGALRWLDSDHYQRNAGEIPIGVVTLTEGGSGPFTWGTGDMTGETDAYVDLVCTPGVINDVADIIVTAGDNVTWAHGAGGVILGSGVYLPLTAQTALPVATNGAAIADGLSGALMLYVISDGVGEALQLSTADASHAAALATAQAEVGNPYMACIGFLIVDNASGAAFTPGTDGWADTGITTTIYTVTGEGSFKQRVTNAPTTLATQALEDAVDAAADMTASLVTTPESQD